MRIIAGAWRGRRLAAPAGDATRPTAERARQALFDMLWHAPWAGPARLPGARVLDAFAGTGALGLEALSRGAAQATFMELAADARRSLLANIAACGAAARCTVLSTDALRPPAADAACGLVFLDPPYGQALLPRAAAALLAAGWIAAGTLLAAESGRDEAVKLPARLLAERQHGAARITVWEWP